MKINMESVSRQKQGGGAKSSNYRFYSRLIATIAAFSFVSLRAGAATYDGDWTVDGQTQLSEDTTVNGRLVFDGGAVDLNGHNLTLNGGWIVPGTDEIIVNGSFESVSAFTANSGAWAYWKDNGKADGWTTADTGLVGISKKEQHWIKYVDVPDGTYVCYLQAQSAAGSSVKQTVSLPKTGYYDLSLFYGVRHDLTYGCGLLSIWVDDVKAFEAVVPNKNVSHFGRAIVRLEEGDHEFVVKNNWNPDYPEKTDQGIWIDKLSLKPLTDLVFNGSFEQESGTWGNYQYWNDGYRAIGWTRTNNVIAGMSVNPWMHNIAAPDGSRTCVLQGQTGDARVAKVSQTIVVPEAGTYYLSFYYAGRSGNGNAGGGGTLSVSIGGDVKFSKTVPYYNANKDPINQEYIEERTPKFTMVEVELAAGEQTIEVANDGGGNDATMWVDAVSLVKNRNAVDPEIGNTAGGDAASLTMVSSGAVALPPLSGNLKLVVSGGGTFTATKSGQSYTGGTEVGANTTLALGTNDTPLGDGNATQTVTLGAGAIYDAGQYFDNTKCTYNLVMGEGSEARLGQTNGTRDARRFGSLTLEGDAKLTYTGALCGLAGLSSAHSTITLAGHELSVDIGGGNSHIKYIKTLDSGTLNFVAGGNMQGYQDADLSSATVKFTGTAWAHLGDYAFKVGGFEYSTSAGKWQSYKATPISVYGKYKAAAFRPALKLFDGATIDLSGVSGSWDSSGESPANAVFTKAGSVVFADGAAINVNLSGRTDLGDLARSASPYVVAWSSQPNATFTLDAATAKYYVIEADETGVKLIRRGGLAIILK